MPERLSVIAAIPSYNMASSLENLLPQIIEQGYDDIYVLDDASTDNTEEVITSFKKVKNIKGEENVGPGANRNRIIPVLDHEAIVHFLDADVELSSQNNPKIARYLFKSNPKLGLVGGLIKLPDERPWIFNYGPRFSLYSQISGWFQAKSYESQSSHSIKAAFFRNHTNYWRKEYPNFLAEPTRKEVFWVGEANMLIRSGVFKEMGGFDPRLRYHEIQDLAINLHDHGYKVLFEPTISVIHPHIDLNDLKRKALQSKAGLQLMRKYGIRIK